MKAIMSEIKSSNVLFSKRSSQNITVHYCDKPMAGVQPINLSQTFSFIAGFTGAS